MNKELEEMLLAICGYAGNKLHQRGQDGKLLMKKTTNKSYTAEEIYNRLEQALSTPTADEIEFLNNLSKELQEQDKISIDCQATPRFWCVAQYEYNPCWVEQADKHLFYDDEGSSYETFDELLEMLIDNGYIDTKLGYEDIDDLKGVYDEVAEVPVKREHIIKQNTMFFTKRECQEHIKRNHYHYNKSVHTYAMTAWRSPQVERIMKFLTTFFMSKEE
jgi:hypothetical protein